MEEILEALWIRHMYEKKIKAMLAQETVCNLDNQSLLCRYQ